MDDCSSFPDTCFIVETKSGEKVLIGVWERTCKGCDTPPLLMAGVITQEEYDEFWSECTIHKTPQMHGEAFAFLEKVIKMEEVLNESLEHLLVEHIHDREQCEDIFTQKGTIRAKWRKIEGEM